MKVKAIHIIAACSVAGLGLFGASVLACLGLILSIPAPINHSKAVKTAIPREEFRRIVMSKTQDEVIKAVGAPKATQDSFGVLSWDYANITTDPATSRVDYRVTVYFRRGKVDRVNFYDFD
jgi:hypothetical protein